MLVSKTFLDEAARVFFRTKTMKFNTMYCLQQALKSRCPVNGHLLRHATSLDLGYLSGKLDDDPLLAFPVLKSLKLKLTPLDLELQTRFPRHDTLSDLDLIGVPTIGQFLELRGLREIVVRDGYERSGTPVWSSLVHQIRALLSDVTSKPRGSNDKTSLIPTVQEILAKHPPIPKPVSKPVSEAIVEKSPVVEAPLKTQELPRDEAGFVRLFFDRPHAMYKWFQEAVDRLNISAL